MRNALLAGLIALATLPAALPAWARGEPSVRDQEIAECRPGEIVTWRDGRDRPALAAPLVFVYRHDQAPAWFSPALVRATLARAIEAWSPCGVPALLIPAGRAAPDDAVRVQWSERDSLGNFGLANLGQRSLSLNPALFALLRSRNPKYDATQTLQMVIAHEMGHLFGLMAHSRRCIDVTSYYDDGKGQRCVTRDPLQGKGVAEYRSVLPTACDIQRCRAANALAANNEGVRKR
jgi:hypothetical protein